MQLKNDLPFITLVLMISFASVNAVLFTPALPAIARDFSISNTTAQLTMTWYLLGYTFGQLLYGPLANRYGRKSALYFGIILQIVSSFICIAAGLLHKYDLLVLGRFLLSLGAGAGLKIAFTIINDYYEPKIASQKIAYLSIAFAITPGLGIAIGGWLNFHFGWMSCFYALAFYGCALFLIAIQLPETQKNLDFQALKTKHLLVAYSSQFKNIKLMCGGLLMGCATAFVYIFAALAPFIAIELLGMSSEYYGYANLLPSLGLITGSLFSARFAKKYSLNSAIQLGILAMILGTIAMLISMLMHLTVIYLLFVPMMLIYFGLSLIFANASTVAMSHTGDKAHGSAVMNFLNMGFATTAVLGLGFLKLKMILLPISFMMICFIMIVLYQFFSPTCDIPQHSNIKSE